MSFVPNDISINGNSIKYISKRLNNKQRVKFLDYYFKNPTEATPQTIMLDGTPTFYYYNIKGLCDHKDVTKHLASYKPKVAEQLRPEKKRSRKRRRSRKKNIIVVYGSDSCGWCKRVTKKLDKLNIGYTKKVL